MTFYKICHACRIPVHYDLVSSVSVHTCQCGRRYRCVIPPVPKVGEKWQPSYWVEILSWRRILGLFRRGR